MDRASDHKQRGGVDGRQGNQTDRTQRAGNCRKFHSAFVRTASGRGVDVYSAMGLSSSHAALRPSRAVCLPLVHRADRVDLFPPVLDDDDDDCDEWRLDCIVLPMHRQLLPLFVVGKAATCCPPCADLKRQVALPSRRSMFARSIGRHPLHFGPIEAAVGIET